MSFNDDEASSSSVPLIKKRKKKQSFLSSPRKFLLFCCTLLLLFELPGIWPGALIAFAAQHAVPPTSTNTYDEFLKIGQTDTRYRGELKFPASDTVASKTWNAAEQTSSQDVPASSEPATMQPLAVSLDTSLVAVAPSSTTGLSSFTAKALPLNSYAPAPQALESTMLKGSDKRFEVTIPAQTFDFSEAQTKKSKAPKGALKLKITQKHGNYQASINLLGAYTIQVVDADGEVLQKVKLKKPLTVTYRYTDAEMRGLGLNPDNLVLSWPQENANAQQAKKSAQPYTVPLVNDAQAHTLTAEVSALGDGDTTLGGNAELQSPPIPQVASVQGNSGQLGYSYPLLSVPGPADTTPDLKVSYSSQITNERKNRTLPAGAVGEGWALSVGSITVEEYSSVSAGVGTWYSISVAGGVSDRMIPDGTGNAFKTLHLSAWKITKRTVNSQPCFDAWDPSGNYYTFGCNNDSLQYINNSTGRKNYRWDLDGVTLANQGPGTSSRFIDYSYLQDMVTKNGYTSVRDAAIKRITYGSSSKKAGTIDFLYQAPFTSAPWATAYGSRVCPSAPNSTSTTLRCDNPVDHPQGLNAPTAMSTFSLQTVKSYVGDVADNKLAYSYAFEYQDSTFGQCWDGLTQIQVYCAGSHLLKRITPTIYQNNTAHPQKAVDFGYTGARTNWYSDPDSSHTFINGLPFTGQTYSNYLNSYYDAQLGTGATINYQAAFNNANGTPNNADGSNRYDPTYCSTHSDCTGAYTRPETLAWSVQVVTSITQKGKDGSNLPEGTTTYKYRLAKTGTTCPAAGSMTDCVGHTFIPKGSTGNKDNDWVNFYHGEFRGFNAVYITNPAGDLTAQYYYSTAGFWTYQGWASNYLSGQLYQQDTYWGNALDNELLITRTDNWYAGTRSTANTCDGNYSGVYTPCGVYLLSSTTTDYSGSNPTINPNAPWGKKEYTYDNYRTTSGLGDFDNGSYGNVQQEVISASNAPTITKKYTYQKTNTNVNGWTYYNVNNVKHSEIIDDAGHVWQCQDNTYDEKGRASGAPALAAGLVTTQTAYANCANQAATAIKSYQGYDSNYNPVVTVDAFGAAHSSLYATKGCTVTTAPAFFTTNWTPTRYTGCTTYDTYNTRATSTTNVLGHTSQVSYDYTFGGIPKTATDINNQTTTVSTTFDANHNATVKSVEPNETGTYTRQSTSRSTCASSSSLPCFVIETNSSLYSGAVKRTFYNSMGKPVQSRTPLDATHDMVTFTVTNPNNNTSFQSLPFRVAKGSNWLDPATVKDDQGNTPGGTTTLYDALGRVTATRDALYGSPASPGINCAGFGPSGTWTTCVGYGLDTAQDQDSCPDLSICYYSVAFTTDANGHLASSYTDGRGRTIQQQWYDSSLNITTYKHVDYNALDKPIAVTVVDRTPRSGQTITSVTTTMKYDDLGRVTELNDPDRGLHTYSYDENGQQIKDVSGTRILGASYDLLGRITCLQEGNPTTDGSGSCGNGNRALVETTYDVNKLSVTDGSTTFPDFPLGKLTQSIATTYYPDGTFAKTTQKVQYDQRGRATATSLNVSVPTAWNVTTALPNYEMLQWYNSANQPTMTKTKVAGQASYTFSQAYDSSTGLQIGLSNDASGIPNIVKQTYNVNGLADKLSYFAPSGATIASSNFTYDGNLRPINTVANWETASGSTGTFFQSSRWYDPAGNVLSVATTHAAVPGQTNSGGSDTQNYCYDEQNRLIWSGNTGTAPSGPNIHCGTQTLNSTLNGGSYTNSFSYTNLGQQWLAPLDSAGQYQYLYCTTGKPHQLTGVYPTGTTCANQTGAVYNATYDNWGNIKTRTFSGATANLSYDVLDHLVQWDAGSNNREWYVYDASGQRVLKRRTDSTSTTIKTYAFSLQEHDYDNVGQPKNGGSTYYYMLGKRLVGKYDGTTTQFYLTDGLGSVVASFSNTEGSATLKGNRAYSPYGKRRYQSGTLGTDKGFTGQYEDQTGLKYYNARYYDSVIGRFVTADTVESNAQGIDPYTYVAGNPTTKVDPTGHAQTCNDACGSSGGKNGGGGLGSKTPTNGSGSGGTGSGGDPGPRAPTNGSGSGGTGSGGDPGPRAPTGDVGSGVSKPNKIEPPDVDIDRTEPRKQAFFTALGFTGIGLAFSEIGWFLIMYALGGWMDPNKGKTLQYMISLLPAQLIDAITRIAGVTRLADVGLLQILALGAFIFAAGQQAIFLGTMFAALAETDDDQFEFTLAMLISRSGSAMELWKQGYSTADEYFSNLPVVSDFGALVGLNPRLGSTIAHWISDYMYKPMVNEGVDRIYAAYPSY